MNQGTDNWLDWRAKGIGSSDAPIIMGVSPWKTAFELWEEKSGKVKKEQESNWATDRGNELEPIVRARYELENFVEMGPACCQHSGYPWLKASMDGWNPQEKIGIEIKFMGINDFNGAKNGIVPEKYFPQIMHQFLVTGAIRIDLLGYHVPKGVDNAQGLYTVVQVFPDIDYIKKLFDEEKKFWDFVQMNIAPPLTEDDFKTIRVKGAKALADKYFEFKDEESKNALIAMTGDFPRYKIGKLKIINKIIVDGNTHTKNFCDNANEDMC